MDISAITSGSATGGNSAAAGTIAQIQGRIQSVQQQIAQLEANQTLDADTKEQRITALESQLRQLQAQLARAQQTQSSASSSSESTPAATSDTVGTRFSAVA